MAINVTTYKWFSYHGRELIFPTGHPDHELHLFDGEIFGYKKFKDKHYLVDKSNTEVRFDLKEKDALRLLKASAGWEGIVDKRPVKGGVGGKDRAPAAADDTSNIHFMEIDSSNLRCAAYDKKAKTLYVGFKTSPAIWAYLNVSKREATELEEAPSQGRYFIYRIREVKAQHRVRSMPTPEEPVPEVDDTPKETPTPKPKATKKPVVKKPVIQKTSGEMYQAAMDDAVKRNESQGTFTQGNVTATFRPVWVNGTVKKGVGRVTWTIDGKRATAEQVKKLIG